MPQPEATARGARPSRGDLLLGIAQDRPGSPGSQALPLTCPATCPLSASFHTLPDSSAPWPPGYISAPIPVVLVAKQQRTHHFPARTHHFPALTRPARPVPPRSDLTRLLDLVWCARNHCVLRLSTEQKYIRAASRWRKKSGSRAIQGTPSGRWEAAAICKASAAREKGIRTISSEARKGSMKTVGGESSE
jgi:hypothetical protein